MQLSTYQAVLQVLQYALNNLLNDHLPQSCNLVNPLNKSVARANHLLNMDNAKVETLSLVFDCIQLSNEQLQTKSHFVPLQKISSKGENQFPTVPYPDLLKPNLQEYQSLIRKELESYFPTNWNNIDFLTFILEKYGSCVSYGDSHTALVDAARMTAAVAVALSQNQASGAEEKFHLVAGSLSGIQKFIYTISSDGALKSLRARSFYLELVAEEIVQQILEKLDLPRTNVIYAGGGNLFILTGGHAGSLENDLKNIQNEFNEWLLKTFQGKIFFALDYQSCDVQDIGSSEFRKCWNKAIAKLAIQKNRKFINQINQENNKLLATKHSYQPCKVCHRDDTDNLKSLNKHDQESPLACETCIDMFKLGDHLPDTSAILRTTKASSELAKYSIEINKSYYHLFVESPKLISNPETETIYQINNWETANYTKGSTVLMLMGRYYQEITENQFPRAEELAANAQGINRVGYLRMDVDRLGQIFAKGLPNKEDSPHNIDEYSLPRVASLSRQMSYFFKVYLNSLASDRANNLPKNAKTLTTESDQNFSRRNLMFIYAGGDDLFISGAWNEVVEFAFDIYQSFRTYTGNHPDITISGGISIDDAKFPLYQSADSSGEAESKAKNNGRDSLGLFGSAFKWEEWLGNDTDKIIELIKKRDKRDDQDKYWEQEKKIPVLAGVVPFVKILIEQGFGSGYSRAFVRNLLKAAQLQEQKLDDLRSKNPKLDSDEARDLRYYLHLPQIAYTISRLPKEVKLSDDFRRSLMSPYNAPYFRAIATWIELLNRSQ
jgi:CRISPR-associated protein Csm1